MLPEDQQERAYQQEQKRIAALTTGTLVEVYRGGIGKMLMRIYAIHRNMLIFSSNSHGEHRCTLYQLEDAGGNRNYYATADFIGLAPTLG